MAMLVTDGEVDAAELVPSMDHCIAGILMASIAHCLLHLVVLILNGRHAMMNVYYARCW